MNGFRSGLLTIAIAATVGVGMADPPADNAVRSRKEILRDASDAGVGLSIGRHRGYQPAADLAQRRSQFFGPDVGATDELANRLLNQQLLYRNFYRQGGPIGCPADFRSPIYQWQPPVVQQDGRQWLIQPGYFWFRPTSPLWTP
ncbi:hypothetical protein Poly51_11360 [Rubripirellula tenax]|uniref:Uncharacterized protein n=1 Tax=Rubripirellula tenax TaxID=2528015 RepID=A0A5C6FLZ9_9BACT|nr:hypothetical protein [Rubripirellula tenax]TWU60854.1 hypothetical protein Poly51_11360 [Rubripirellula tenax]